MNTLSRYVAGIINEAGLEVQDDALQYVSKGDLEKYLEIADKFLSDESRRVTAWLVAHDDTYMRDIGPLPDFYAKGPENARKAGASQLYADLGRLSKRRRLLEVPVFLSREQLSDILTRKVSPDEILLDLATERGRTECYYRYEDLIHKVANSFKGSLRAEDLFSAALEGFTWALNRYGKVSKREAERLDKLSGEDAESMRKESELRKKSTTFMTFAGYMCRAAILEAIKNEKLTVRVAASAQSRARAETGSYIKNNTVSGDKPVGHDDTGGTKTLFDYIDSKEAPDKGVDREDAAALWRRVKAKLDKKFSPQTLDIFYGMRGLFGHKKVRAAELQKKYGIKFPSQVTAYSFKVMQYIRSDKELSSAFDELRILYKESLDEEDAYRESLEEPRRLSRPVKGIFV